MATKSSKSSGSQHNQRGVVQGNTLVDPKTGLPVNTIVDGSGVRRLAVDTTISVDNLTVSVDLNSDTDQVAVEDPDTGAHIKVETDGSVNANIEADALDGDNIAISGHPNQIYNQFADTLTTTTFEQIFYYTSTDNNTKILLVETTGGTPSTFRVKINGTIIREKRSSPLEKNIIFSFLEHRPLASGSVITVEAKVDRLIQASHDTFTSIEGYIA